MKINVGEWTRVALVPLLCTGVALSVNECGRGRQMTAEFTRQQDEIVARVARRIESVLIVVRVMHLWETREVSPRLGIPPPMDIPEELLVPMHDTRPPLRHPPGAGAYADERTGG